VKIIKNACEHVVLATWPSEETNANAQMVLEKAGRTCYQSEKGPITSETANKFVEARLKTGHYAVIEHGWRGYIIKIDPYFSEFTVDTFKNNKFTYITYRTADNTILVSANLETWRKLYYSVFMSDLNTIGIFKDIIIDLEKFAPAIFKSSRMYEDLYVDTFEILPITSEDQLITDEEKLFHIAHTIQYNNCSRGLTHELVRHRPPVYAQESTRYVDESDFKVIVPPHKNENEKTISISIFGNDYDLSLAEWLELNEQAYTSLRNNKWKNEDARQILPTAIKAQIVMSCNLLERRYIYYRRTSFAAHWEIRKLMCDELSQFAKEKYPELFSMFVFNDSLAKDGLPGYCTSTEPDSFFCDK
jgi:thymidylate synthase (FAD)